MRKVAEWIRGTLASRREANRQLAGNASPGAALLFGSNTEPTPVTARRASEPGFRGLPLSEDGIFLVDAESGNVLDTRRKDEFLATISHELRSPLASIQNAVRLLSIQVGESHARQRAQAMIERQVRRMTQLVDDLLDLSRISHGRMHLKCERIDLREVLGNAIETLESDINERNHHLTTSVPDGPVWLNADPLRLEQVFVNLLWATESGAPPCCSNVDPDEISCRRRAGQCSARNNSESYGTRIGCRGTIDRLGDRTPHEDDFLDRRCSAT
jgi:signal transduction histidine kinase